MKTNKILQTIISNWPAKVIALLLAIALFLFIQYTTIGERRVTIPIHVTLPESLVASSLIPDSVELVIKGDEEHIYLIDPSSITATIDFSFATTAGIARAPVILQYDRSLFRVTNVSITAQPDQYRVLFEMPGVD